MPSTFAESSDQVHGFLLVSQAACLRMDSMDSCFLRNVRLITLSLRTARKHRIMSRVLQSITSRKHIYSDHLPLFTYEVYRSKPPGAAVVVD